MASNHYFLLTCLPHLGELGSVTSLTTRQLLNQVQDDGATRDVIETLLLGDDLHQRDAVLAGELSEAAPVVLTADQLGDKEPLPSYLVRSPNETASGIVADAVWGAYFTHAATVAGGAHSGFLTAWVGREVALRNALAVARAKTLDLDPQQYLVATELADGSANFTSLINEWSAAANPLAGLRVIDRDNWNWLTERQQWFTFGDDELAAYAARLMLIKRWHRLEQTDSPQPTAVA